MTANTLVKGWGLGFSGAHRSGKSTIMKVISDTTPKIPAIWSAATNVAQDMGIKVGPDMSEESRCVYQEAVMASFVPQWAGLNSFFFCDRTPLDFAAYALADVTHQSTEEFKTWVKAYTQRCLEITGDYFAAVMVVQPGIPYVAEEGKPPPDTLYQERHAAFVTHLALQLPDRVAVDIIPRDVTGLPDRVTLASRLFNSALKDEYRCCGQSIKVH